MDFKGPDRADFRNVQAMNRGFLTGLRSGSGEQLRQQMPRELQPLIASLTDLQIERLSATPFLLFSLRERDEEFWSHIASNEPDGDLLAAPDSGLETGQLAASGLGFLWQLSRRNPYAARLVSGATLSWCEQLAECTLFRLLRRMAGRGDLLRPRRASDAGFWSKLLGPALSSEYEVRHAAQLSSLQAILTEDPARRYRQLPVAACNTLLPSLSVAEKGDRL